MTKLIQKHVFYINNKTYFVIPTSNKSNFVYSSLSHKRRRCKVCFNSFMTEAVHIFRNQSKSMDWFLYDNGLRHESFNSSWVTCYMATCHPRSKSHKWRRKTHTHTHKKSGWNWPKIKFGKQLLSLKVTWFYFIQDRFQISLLTFSESSKLMNFHLTWYN